MITYNLFPTPVVKYELGRDFTSEENGVVIEQQTHKNVGNTVSENNYVLQNPKLADISKFIQESVDSYFKNIYAPCETVSLRVTQSWFNYSKPGEWHHKHAHPNSLISGVLYMKAAKESDKIHFYKDNYRQIDLPTENFNLYNSQSWWLPVETGCLMMFPSSLTHSVEPVQGTDERISLAFNTFPVGYVGNDKTLTGLHL